MSLIDLHRRRIEKVTSRFHSIFKKYFCVPGTFLGARNTSPKQTPHHMELSF
jgi:hypothetical protein